MTSAPPAPGAPDPTLSLALRSWVESAQDPASDFPIQNLPLCTFIRDDAPGEGHGEDDDGDRPLCGVGIGDSVVDVDMLLHAGFFEDEDEALVDRLHHALHMPVLNALAGEGSDVRRLLRRKVQAFLLDGHAGQQIRRLRQKAVVKQSEVEFVVPMMIGDYTDFYASVHHARNVGSMFRPDNPLLPNYKHVPIGYHGRASSIVPSGTDIPRPKGQANIENGPAPTFGPSRRLDYELEMACIVGPGNELGDPIGIDNAGEHILGFSLLNDWSARDIQAWEYQPLGPFLAKNFATTISPWIVTIDAVNPFRLPGPPREEGDPQPLPYLQTEQPWALDVMVEVDLRSAKMRAQGLPPLRLSRANLRDMYWTFPQMLAHHTSNGCNLQPGDVLGSGTISGAGADSRGCLLELTWQGNGPDGKPLARKPVQLPSGESRVFLEDGDEVSLRGWCEREGLPRIGFGECTGVITPA